MNSDASRSPVPAADVGADPAGWADGVGGEGRDLPASRGFLGRLFGAFSGGDDGNTIPEEYRAPDPAAPPWRGWGWMPTSSSWVATMRASPI